MKNVVFRLGYDGNGLRVLVDGESATYKQLAVLVAHLNSADSVRMRPSLDALCWAADMPADAKEVT